MIHPLAPRRRRAGTPLLAVLAAGLFGLEIQPGLTAATPGDGAMPGAVWIDFGTNGAVLRAQLVRGAQGFLGMAEVKANGTGRMAQVTQQLSIPDAPAEDGLYHATGSHVFLFADGSSFSTLDELVLIPAGAEGQFVMDGTLRIVGGTGILAAVAGDLSLMGNLDVLKGEVSVDTRGKVQK